jgi:hypothetical protein
MTSNMIRWTESTHYNGVRLEQTEVRHEHALGSFARARAELQHLVDQAAAAGASAGELAGMRAFRAALGRAAAFGGELQLTTALRRL